MGAAPYLNKNVVDTARRYDRMLNILWCPRRDRFTLVRFQDDGFGKYNELHVFEGPLGEFVMPNENSVAMWLSNSDITRTHGATFKDKIRNFIRKQDARNAELRDRQRAKRSEENVDLLGEYYKASKKFNGNFEDTAKYMGERKQEEPT